MSIINVAACVLYPTECEVDYCVKCNPKDVDKCSICDDGYTLSEDETQCEG